MEATINAALTEARRRLQALYGDRLRRVVLFGSRARNAAHSESDVDVLVVIEGPFDLDEETRRLVDVEILLMEQFGLFFQLLPYDEDTVNDPGHSLMARIRAEGVKL